MGFSRQECWSGLPFPSPGDLPDPGIEPGSPAFQADALPSEPPGSNRQVWPWSTEWSRAKANRVLPREYTGHIKHPLPTTKEMILHMDITRWSILKSDWLYSLQPKMEKLYTVSKKRPGADCASDHELLSPKFRLKLKKVGKTTRPFRYDLSNPLWLYSGSEK